MSAPVCAKCKANPGPFFWLGSHACKSCYTEAMVKLQKGAESILEAVAQGFYPRWAADKDLVAITRQADWRRPP